MALGRFGVILPVLAIAGSLAAKKRLVVTDGTLPTHGPLFVGLLIGTVPLVGLLNYVPPPVSAWAWRSAAPSRRLTVAASKAQRGPRVARASR